MARLWARKSGCAVAIWYCRSFSLPFLKQCLIFQTKSVPFWGAACLKSPCLKGSDHGTPFLSSCTPSRGPAADARAAPSAGGALGAGTGGKVSGPAVSGSEGISVDPRVSFWTLKRGFLGYLLCR